MKTNVTLKLDADLLREARVLAAEEGRSISALLTDRLEAIVRERKAFDKARRRALARLREGLDLGSEVDAHLAHQVGEVVEAVVGIRAGVAEDDARQAPPISS